MADRSKLTLSPTQPFEFERSRVQLRGEHFAPFNRFISHADLPHDNRDREARRLLFDRYLTGLCQLIVNKYRLRLIKQLCWQVELAQRNEND